MKVFTVSNGAVSDSTTVEKLTLSGAGIAIPAILIGEEGRGRARGVMPVQLPPHLQAEWKNKNQVKVKFGEIGKTKADN